MRMCTGCGLSRPKRELVRVVRTAEGDVCVDLTGRKPGRGAYLCPNGECVKKVQKNRRLSRSLECEIPPEVFDKLIAEFAKKE